MWKTNPPTQSGHGIWYEIPLKLFGTFVYSLIALADWRDPPWNNTLEALPLDGIYDLWTSQNESDEREKKLNGIWRKISQEQFLNVKKNRKRNRSVVAIKL